MLLSLIPIGPLPISAASGLVEVRETLWVVADDENVLVGSGSAGSGGAWDERIVLVADRLPEDPVARKSRKPDFEAIAILPAERLFVLGSGSTPSRRRGVVVDLQTRVVTGIDLTPLFVALERQIPELNIEGAVVHGDGFFLAQRGNGVSAWNALVRLDLVRALSSMARFELAADTLEWIVRVELPSIDDVPLALTDLASDGHELYFSAAAEDSASTYHDGACRGSVLGRISERGTVAALRRLEGHAKIEGLCVDRKVAGKMRAWLVGDADDREVRAQLYRIDALELV